LPTRRRPWPLLAEARHNCEFVEEAHGVHNPDYALELLDRATTAAEKAERLARR